MNILEEGEQMRKDIVFVVDSGSDYEAFLEHEFHFPIRVVPLKVIINNQEYLDGVDLDKNEFYEKMASTKELPKTSQPSPQTFYDVFNVELERGNEIVYIGITSRLSGTFQSALIAKEMFTDEKQTKIHLVDSLNVSAVVLFLLRQADIMLEEGRPIPEVIQSLIKNREKIHLLALLDTLENLKKGGRVSLAQATIGGILNIKPLVTLKDGLVETLDKFRGRKKGLRALSELLTNPEQNLDYSRIFIVHSYTDEEQLKEELKEMNLSSFRDVIYLKLGTTIGTHAGANTLGIVYNTL